MQAIPRWIRPTPAPDPLRRQHLVASLYLPQKILGRRPAHHERVNARGHADPHRDPHPPGWMVQRRSASPRGTARSNASHRGSAHCPSHQGVAAWHLAIGAEPTRGWRHPRTGAWRA